MEKNKKYAIKDNKNLDNLNFDLNDNILNLDEFKNLKVLYLFKSKIKKIIIPRNNLIKYVCIEDNDELEHIDFKNLNAENITEIKIKNNPKLIFNIDIFSEFINLWIFEILNSNCHGSLISLIKLTNLKILYIYNVQIKPSYEYLNNEVKIFLPIDEKIIYEKIDQNNLNNKFLLNINKKIRCRNKFFLEIKDFKEVNPQLFENAEMIADHQSTINSWKKSLYYKKDKEVDFWWRNKKLIYDALFNPNQSFNYWLEEKEIKIDKLKKENEEYYQNFFEQTCNQ